MVKCLLESVESIEIELLENNIVNEDIVNVLLNRFIGTLQHEQLKLDTIQQEMKNRMEQMILLLQGKYSELKEEQDYGLRIFKECLTKQQEGQNNEEIEEENENEEKEKEELEVEFEDGIDLDKKGDEEWDELDENDYTQLIDHQRFKEIKDTSVFQQKVSDSYICCIDSRDGQTIMGSGNDKLYFKGSGDAKEVG